MVGEDRINELLKAIKKLQESKQPIKKYFENNSVPFSRSQYYAYCQTLQKYGEDGLRDHREDGNYTKLTKGIKDFIVGTVNENRSISSSQLKNKILSIFGVNLSEASINIFRASKIQWRGDCYIPGIQHRYNRYNHENNNSENR